MGLDAPLLVQVGVLCGLRVYNQSFASMYIPNLKVKDKAKSIICTRHIHIFQIFFVLPPFPHTIHILLFTQFSDDISQVHNTKP